MSLIGRFEHLPNRPRSDEARPLLEKIASQVKPIMNKRGWKVGTLAEFLPANPALLGNNMNAGARINLRLRPPGNTSTFYEYDQLVLVMLHELTHIEHGPHDAKFYKLLAELEEEYYDLKRKGYSGEGFHGKGNHLSGFKVPEYVGKAKGLQAAEARLAMQRKIGKGGVLGGRSVEGRSMKEVLAEAAERRIRDDKACGTTGAVDVEAEVRKAQEESVGIDAIDLTGDTDSEPEPIPPIEPPGKAPTNPPVPLSSASTTKLRETAGPSRAVRHQPYPAPPINKLGSSLAPSPASSATVQNGTSATVIQTHEWSCPTCTLLNPTLSLQCEACQTPKPARKGEGEVWWCEFCGHGPREMGYWSCKECGWVRKWG